MEERARVQGWIDAARRGDEEAVAELCRRYEERLAAYVLRNMGRNARRWVDPADLVQRVLFETVRGLAKLPDGADENELLKRLYRTAKTRIYDVSRKHEGDLGESVVPVAAREPGKPRPATGAVTRQDTRRWVEEVLDQLPEESAAVLRLCGLEELSFVDAGKRLGLQADTVRKRYERARELLAQKLAGKELL